MTSFVSLMYHNVFETRAAFPELSPSITSYFVSKERFEQHLTELACRGQWINSDRMRLLFDGTSEAMADTESDRPPVQITFDDGWRGSVEVAGPILERHNCEALLFVTTDLISRPDFVNPHDLQQLPTQTFRVGSHGRTHRLLAHLSSDEIREELTSSRHLLEDIVGYEIDMLSIPGGAADQRVCEIAAEVGYRFVFTSNIHTNPSQNGPLDIGRLSIRTRTSTKALKRYLNHDFRRERWRQSTLRFGRMLLSDAVYGNLRRRLLRERPQQHEMTDLGTIDPPAPAGCAECTQCELHQADME